MKNTLILIIVIILVIFGVMFFTGGGNEAEAPAGEAQNQEGAIVEPETSLAVKEFIVTGKNFSFDPALITVRRGDKVKITFINSQGFHDFKIDEFGAATKQIQAPGTEVLEFVADKAGTFEYYCSVGSHRSMGMVGTLVVE